MYPNILNNQQKELLSLVAKFRREFYLVGGTAIAIIIGHRRSIDFDLFKFSKINHVEVFKKINKIGYEFQITRKTTEQLNMVINGVSFTFFQYPFKISAKKDFQNICRMPDLLTLASMKAYALGRRSKWKDYVDLYMIIKNHYTVSEISEKASEIFGELFLDKLFRSQLSFFNDIDFSEKIEYLIPEISIDEVKNYLTDKATDIF
jgi:hypothetical protein